MPNPARAGHRPGRSIDLGQERIVEIPDVLGILLGSEDDAERQAGRADRDVQVKAQDRDIIGAAHGRHRISDAGDEPVSLVVAAQEPADEWLRSLHELRPAPSSCARSTMLPSADENVAATLVDVLHDEIVDTRAPQVKVFASTTADDIEAIVRCGPLVAHLEPGANGRKVPFECSTHKPQA